MPETDLHNDAEKWLIETFARLDPKTDFTGVRAVNVFCRTMRKMRIDAGLSQERAAELAHTHQSTIHAIENTGGDIVRSLLRFHRIMSAYGVSIEIRLQ